jgi:hypothetical protein
VLEGAVYESLKEEKPTVHHISNIVKEGKPYTDMTHGTVLQ